MGCFQRNELAARWFRLGYSGAACLVCRGLAKICPFNTNRKKEQMLICNASLLLGAAYRERDIYVKHPDGG